MRLTNKIIKLNFLENLFLRNIFIVLIRLVILFMCKTVATLRTYDKSTGLLNLKYFYFLMRWDAIYFLEIAKAGYTNIQQSAFFPLYPLLCRILSQIFKIDNFEFTGIILSNILYIINANLLIIFFQSKVETLTLIFCFYPTSIIFSSFYTESLFLFLILCALLISSHSILIAYFFISISCLCRSNGILFAFLPFFIFNNFLSKFINFVFLSSVCKIIIDLFQIHCKKAFNIPSSYEYVQRKFWHQGFLNFYNFKKFPGNILNFLIGCPFIFFITKFNFKFYFRKEYKNEKEAFLSFVLFIQIFIFLMFFHLQVFMRFISTNPIVYLLISRNRKYFQKFCVIYSVCYSILFCCYYPPT